MGRGEETRLLPLVEPVTVAADVDGRGMVQQAIQDGRGDDRITEDRAPIAVALVAGEEDAAAPGSSSGRYPISSMTGILGAR